MRFLTSLGMISRISNSEGDATDQWPFDALDLSNVQAFVKRGLSNATFVSEPLEIYAQYNDGPDRRTTVRFATDDPKHLTVVVKLNQFPFLSGSPAAHRLVDACSPGRVPNILAIEEDAEGSLILFEVFDGTSIEKQNALTPVLEVATTLGKIQRGCSDESAKAKGLQAIELSDFTGLFQMCVANIGEHSHAWEADDGKLHRAMGCPGPEVLNKLHSFGKDMDNWVTALDESRIDLSIEHGDCHAGNAVKLIDGSILIFDWENACRTHPFLSAEKLLTSGWAFDSGTSGGPWGYVRNTPSQDQMKTRYLAEFGGPNTRLSRAFDAAMCIAVIKEMHHEMEWAGLCGWKDLNPEWTAQLVNRLTHHSSYFKN